jgi:mRNA interferase MazF
VSVTYVPDRGHLVWLTFDLRAGREQAGRRPALVLSPDFYNARSGLALVCPITSQIKGYPFELPLPQGLAISGVIVVDHVKSLDWRVRRAAFVGVVPAELLVEVAAMLMPLVERA